MCLRSTKQLSVLSQLFDGLLVVEPFRGLCEHPLLKPVHLIDFIDTLQFNIVIRELNSNVFPEGFPFEICIEPLLGQLEIPRKVELVRNGVTVFHFVLLFIRRELVHDRPLDGFLLLAYAGHPLLHVRVLHLVLPQAEDEVVREFLDSPEDVHVCTVLRVELLRLQLLCHSAQHLDVVGVVHCRAHELERR